ncbi:MAG: sugar ABC transporter ATP-binding protein [Haliscomenobacter sp.]|uniref:sugar ABC transporter ATP-binding protein n=1 Tax=Haliscomenobacter sp. TaxID=2717303 RepID=UPI0029AC70EA|nr:sugar ABC transporter ATP-binding protein [Haliscomenobacter sp.]MDX2071106.1 sugar ABC transporter ATP-binding protein [Haliscomenobacter sp.]
MLELINISKFYPGVKALQQVSLCVIPGAIHAICGENGAGKSTLMNIIAGNVQPDEGSIRWQGEHIFITSARAAQDLGIGIVHQERSLAENLSIAENVFVEKAPRQRWGWIDRRALNQQTQQLLAELGLLQLSPQQLVSSLSPAQKQLIEIAKALAVAPKLLILDEPSSSLGEQETQLLFGLLQQLKLRGTAILYISHRMAEIFQIADQITVLKDGQSQGSYPAANLDHEKLIQLMVGRKLAQESFASFASKEVCLKIEQLRGVGFSDISFELYRGEILGLAGLIGAGRSELARALFGDQPIQTGTIELAGKAVQFKHPFDAIAAGLAYVPEERKNLGLFLDKSMLENIQSVFLHKQFWLNLEVPRIAEHYREKLRIKTPSLAQQVGLLSGGNQQKIVLAKWLATKPQVLIVDEPTQGIDIGAKVEIYQLLKQLSQEGIGILLISSELPELLLLADRIAVMQQGQIAGILPKEQASEAKIMQLATGQQIQSQ